MRGIIAEAAPDLPVTAVQTMEQLVARETAPRVVQLRVLGGFAVIEVPSRAEASSPRARSS